MARAAPNQGGPRPDEGELRASLERLLASPEFAESDRIKRFLEYSFEKTLAGDSLALREAALGVAVFERPEGYDTRLDPIVRVEARRLRDKLDRYYQAKGRSEAIRFSLPKGGYTLAIERTGEPAPAASENAEEAPAREVFIPPERRRHWRWAGAAAVAGLLAATGLGVWWQWPSSSRLLSGQLEAVTGDIGLTTDPDVTPDGKWLAYSSDRDTRREQGQLALYAQKLPDGKPLRLTWDRYGAVEPALDPRGRWVVYRSLGPAGGLYVVPTAGGEPTLIAPNGQSPQVSPHGIYVAYTVRDSKGDWSQLRVVATSGDEPRKPAAQFANTEWPVWAESGRALLVHGTWIPGDVKREKDWWLIPFPEGKPVRTGIQARLEKAGIEFRRPVAKASWRKGWLYFGTGEGGGSIVRVGVSETGEVTREPERLTLSTRWEQSPAAAGEVVYFSAGEYNSNIWRLPLDPDSGEAQGAPEPLVRHSSLERSPEPSPDERTLAFLGGRIPQMLDLASGESRPLIPGWSPPNTLSRGNDTSTVLPLSWITSAEIKEFGIPHSLDAPLFGDSGQRVAIRGWHQRPDSTVLAVDLVEPERGRRRRACVHCGAPSSLSESRSLMLYEDAGAVPAGVRLDLTNGRQVTILRHSEWGVRMPRLAPNGKWVAFHVDVSPGRRQVMVSPYTGQETPPTQWAPVTGSEAKHFNPRWSPDGRILYFLSNHDGAICIWARRFDPERGQPVGEEFAVEHHHRAAESIVAGAGVSERALGPAVGKRGLYYVVQEARANIWRLHLDR